MKTDFYSHGKLLLTAEYVVLDGAKALAVPTKLGQSLEVFPTENKELHWKSINEKNEVWLEEKFQLPFEKNGGTKNPVAKKLLQILTEAARFNPNLFIKNQGFQVTTKMEFPQNWGLGSSSTLINNLAEWFQIDAYELLEKTFGGSGYDIACAKNDSPIVFERYGKEKTVSRAAFSPIFKNQLFFVHLNQKQDSRKAIEHYRKQEKKHLSEAIIDISKITEKLIVCEKMEDFEKLLTHHEQIISSLIGLPPVKKQLFSDYPHVIKSLGGWGGDFVLVVGGENEKDYFRKKGFETIVDYTRMVL
ncbi:MAG TPA: GYDIA family GHMP kinase [Flavobacteriaceae bacterium]|nr:GYDIA family GHMP kinase [Flavobacteriaceae bacterium]